MEGEQAELLAGMRSTPKQIPCSFLYDAIGSALYEKITKLDEYYPYCTELSMLQELAGDIITHIPAGAVVVELGCGSATKTATLQRALLERDGPEGCTFVGIDVSGDFLLQAKANMLEACPGLLNDRVELIQAAYMEGLKEARAMHPDQVLCVLWLGSSVGNLPPEETVTFFRSALSVLGPKTQFLLCTDLWKDAETLHSAYCDSSGVTEAFIKNGLANALATASQGSFRMDQAAWEYRVVVNPEAMQVEMYVIAGESMTLGNAISISPGEAILIEISRKFTIEQLRSLAVRTGFFFQAQWRNPKYAIQMFCAPWVAASLAWRDTDALFSRIPDWMEAPIDLRHPFCFYYGHMASFAKLHLLKVESASEMDVMFSRGIDPDVEDPNQCHEHPTVPTKWPSCNDIIQYVEKCRQVMRTALQGVEQVRLVSMVVEHERLHQETLCYMLAQQKKQRWEAKHQKQIAPPAGSLHSFADDSVRKSNNGTLLGCKATANGSESSSKAAWQSGSFVEVPSGEVSLGVKIGEDQPFVWDNEGPPQAPVKVEAFRAAAHPVTIAEFREFIIGEKGYSRPELWEAGELAVLQAAGSHCPATWTITTDGDVWVHFPEGSCNWQQVKDHPVWCSLAEAQAFCKSRGCRIMSELEYSLALSSDPAGKRLKQLESGGWEWTSTLFEPFQGFQPTPDYKEYSTDFFDGKHFVLKGSSPNTHPCATRSSFRNFYQAAYPYVFAKFRCCA